MTSDPNRYVIVGQVVGVFGIKGWVKIHSDTEPVSNILDYSPWYLSRQGDWQLHKLKTGQLHGKGLIAELEGISDRDQAAELVGCQIAISRSQLPAPAEGEYYWSDLIGLRVENLQGEKLGQVSAMMPTGANDVLVVSGAGQEILIPFVLNHYIYKIDLENGSIQVDWQMDDDAEDAVRE